MTVHEEDNLLALARAADDARWTLRKSLFGMDPEQDGFKLVYRVPTERLIGDIDRALKATFALGLLDRCDRCGQIETIDELHDPGNGQTYCHECRAG